MIFRRRRRVPNTEGIKKARHAREESERRLNNAWGLLDALRELREENHITEDVRRAIAQRVQEQGR